MRSDHEFFGSWPVARCGAPRRGGAGLSLPALLTHRGRRGSRVKGGPQVRWRTAGPWRSDRVSDPTCVGARVVQWCCVSFSGVVFWLFPGSVLGLVGSRSGVKTWP